MLSLKCQTCGHRLHVHQDDPYAVCSNCGAMNSPQFHPGWNRRFTGDSGDPLAPSPPSMQPTQMPTLNPSSAAKIAIIGVVALLIIGAAAFIFFQSQQGPDEPGGAKGQAPDMEGIIQFAIFGVFIVFSIVSRLLKRKYGQKPEEEEEETGA